MASTVQVKAEPDDIIQRILSLCRESPQGIGDKFLQNAMPDIDPKSRAKAINQVPIALAVQLHSPLVNLILLHIFNLSSSVTGYLSPGLKT